MKAITLHQPWASLISIGVKTIETRSWATSYRGPIAIHAGVKQPSAWGAVGDYSVVAFGRQGLALNGPGLPKYRSTPKLEGHMLPLGKVLATCMLVDCLPMTDHAELGDPECVVVGADFLDHCIPGGPQAELDANVVHLDRVDIPDGAHLIRSIDDQRPYGDFAPGRFAWMLEDVEPFVHPIAARGFQRVWNWTPNPTSL